VLGLGMALVVIAILAGEIWHHDFNGSAFEKSLRFASMLPLLWLFLHIQPERLRQAQWGLALGALVSAGLLMFPLETIHTRPNTSVYTPYNTVSFGNLTLLFAVLCLFAAAWPAPGSAGRAARWLKTIAGVAGLYGFVLSETRSGWLAMPVFGIVALLALRQASMRWRLAVLAVVVAGGLSVAALSPGLNGRIVEGIDQWNECRADPQQDTSVCIRLQLAGAAGRMFLSSPIFGVGAGNFRASLASQHEQGLVSANVAVSFGETHNDLLYYLAVHGLLGIGALLIMYLVPTWVFARRMTSPDFHLRLVAAMGLSFCLGFAVFGLTEMMFRGMRTVSFYSMWVAALLALSWRTRGHDGSTRS